MNNRPITPEVDADLRAALNDKYPAIFVFPFYEYIQLLGFLRFVLRYPFLGKLRPHYLDMARKVADTVIAVDHRLKPIMAWFLEYRNETPLSELISKVGQREGQRPIRHETTVGRLWLWVSAVQIAARNDEFCALDGGAQLAQFMAMVESFSQIINQSHPLAYPHLMEGWNKAADIPNNDAPDFPIDPIQPPSAADRPN